MKTKNTPQQTNNRRKKLLLSDSFMEENALGLNSRKTLKDFLLGFQ